MRKKVMVISTSIRKNSNSEVLAKEFARGARDSGNNVELITLNEKKINFCTGCLACQSIKKCVINDDVKDIVDKVEDADVLVFATPIYFYAMSGLMKTLIDRFNPLFDGGYKFRAVFLLATAADENESAIDGAIAGLNGFIECFDKSKLKGVIRGLGLVGSNEINKEEFNGILQSAYKMGNEI